MFLFGQKYKSLFSKFNIPANKYCLVTPPPAKLAHKESTRKSELAFMH
jgi:hypothetical protein